MTQFLLVLPHESQIDVFTDKQTNGEVTALRYGNGLKRKDDGISVKKMKGLSQGRFQDSWEETLLSAGGIGDMRSAGVPTHTREEEFKPSPKSLSHPCRAEKVIVSAGRNA